MGFRVPVVWISIVEAKKLRGGLNSVRATMLLKEISYTVIGN